MGNKGLGWSSMSPGGLGKGRGGKTLQRIIGAVCEWILGDHVLAAR